MPKTENQNSYRWQTLDIIKTIGLFGAVSGHILVWGFLKGSEGVGGMEIYDANASGWLIMFCFMMVHLLLISAGASLFFYVRKNKPSFKKIMYRVAPIIAIGLLFGLNYSPLILYWNVFLFYALSIVIIFTLNRFIDYKIILYLTATTLVATPLLRLFLNTGATNNYLASILIGNSGEVISFYPIFPWFFLMGSGFLVSHFYLQHRDKITFIRGLLFAASILVCAIPFLIPLNLTDIFGVTSQIPIGYVVFVFGLFIFLVSALELIFWKRKLSKYNPIVAIGKHIFPVYIATVFVILVLIDITRKRGLSLEGVYTFLLFEIAIFLTAYLFAAFLTYRAGKKMSYPQEILPNHN